MTTSEAAVRAYARDKRLAEGLLRRWLERTQIKDG